MPLRQNGVVSPQLIGTLAVGVALGGLKRAIQVRMQKRLDALADRVNSLADRVGALADRI